MSEIEIPCLYLKNKHWKYPAKPNKKTHLYPYDHYKAPDFLNSQHLNFTTKT